MQRVLFYQARKIKSEDPIEKRQDKETQKKYL